MLAIILNTLLLSLIILLFINSIYGIYSQHKYNIYISKMDKSLDKVLKEFEEKDK